MENLTSAANKVAASLSAAPTLLVIVLLNVFMIVAAVWFLSRQDDRHHLERMQMLEMMKSCGEAHRAARALSGDRGH